MPDPNTHLNWSKQSLHLKLWQETALMLGSIGEECLSLDLSDNFLGNKAGEGLNKIFKAIPKHVHYLNLSANHLMYKAKMRTQVSRDLGKLKDVTSLNLSHNGLYQLGKEKFGHLMSCFSPTLNELDLSHNGLYNTKKKDRPEFGLASLSPGVTTVSLASNDFGLMKTHRFAQALSPLPMTLRTLNLADNNLDDARIEALFPALRRSNVHELNINGNPRISEHTLEQLRSILDANQTIKPLPPVKHSESEKHHFLRRKRHSAEIMEIDPHPKLTNR